MFDDADLDKAIPVIVGAIVQNAGQTCSAGSRVLIQQSIFDEVLGRVAARFRELRVGGPDSAPDCGPIITHAQYGRVKQFIAECLDSGLQLVAEGSFAEGTAEGGYYVKPTLFGPVPRIISWHARKSSVRF